MSAHLVDAEHIHVMIHAALTYGGGANGDLNALYKEDDAYVYTYQRPERFDWEPVEILGAINGYEYQACETSDWITSEAKAFCDRLRKLAESHLPNASDAPWTISRGDVPLHKRLAAEKRANRE